MSGIVNQGDSVRRTLDGGEIARAVNLHALWLEGLAGGMYYLRLRTEATETVRKLSIVK